MKTLHDTIPADPTTGIWQSIGFKEFLPYLTLRSQGADSTVLDEARRAGVEKMKSATRQYARTQIKWIRIKFLNALRGEDAGEVFLLDSTDLDAFKTSVVDKGVEIARGTPPPYTALATLSRTDGECSVPG